MGMDKLESCGFRPAQHYTLCELMRARTLLKDMANTLGVAPIALDKTARFAEGNTHSTLEDDFQRLADHVRQIQAKADDEVRRFIEQSRCTDTGRLLADIAAFNQQIKAIERPLAQWLQRKSGSVRWGMAYGVATNEYPYVPIADTIEVTVFFPQGLPSCFFRLPSARCANSAVDNNSRDPVLRFHDWAGSERLQEVPDFLLRSLKLADTVRVLYEYGGLDWPAMLCAESLRFSIDGQQELRLLLGRGLPVKSSAWGDPK